MSGNGSNVRNLTSGRVVAAFVRMGQRLKETLAPRLPPEKEEWWIEVLHDRRARWPRDLRLAHDGPHAHLRVDRFKAQTVVLKCSRCKLRRTYQRDDLVRRFGGDFNRVVMRYRLVPCPAQHRDAVFEPCHLDYE